MYTTQTNRPRYENYVHQTYKHKFSVFFLGPIFGVAFGKGGCLLCLCRNLPSMSSMSLHVKGCSTYLLKEVTKGQGKGHIAS